METKNKFPENEFHAVEFMRQVRSEMTEKYMQDKEQYLEYLKKVMEDFKLRQEKPTAKRRFCNNRALR